MDTTIEHDGFTIRIEHDDITGDETNPLKEDYANGVTYMIYSSDGIEGNIETPMFTLEEIKGHEQEIAEALEYTSLKDMADNFRESGMDDEELVNYGIEHFLIWSLNNDDEKRKLFAKLYAIKGYKTLETRGHGYAQRDWHEITLLMDPKVQGEYGDPESALEGLADSYRDWRYGDVYGYRVTKANTCECCQHTRHTEIDACWGFIGREGSETYKYMIEQAKEQCAI